MVKISRIKSIMYTNPRRIIHADDVGFSATHIKLSDFQWCLSTGDCDYLFIIHCSLFNSTFSVGKKF